MSSVRVCTECGNSLSGKSVQTRTCSDKCRQDRSRRLRREANDAAGSNKPAGVAAVRELIQNESRDVITSVMRDELRPIVREALTEDVLRSVADMLALSPRAVEQLKWDLESEDSTVRQRAYSLVIKYTVGHPALLKPQDTEPGGQLVVNFNLPRPDDVPVEGGEVVVEALQVCDSCGEEKSESEFVSGSSRCQGCFSEWRAKILAEFG